MEPSSALNLAAVDIMDVLPVAVAFLFGFAARLAALPPLVGFLAAGFLLGGYGFTNSGGLQAIADLGVTLLLFTIGLKLKIKELLVPVVWVTAAAHMGATTLLGAGVVLGLGAVGLGLFAGASVEVALLIGFALSFSSTVFAVKTLEERGEMGSLHGRIAIGVLIMQDLFAVVFLAVSAGKIPSPWALMLLALVPLRPLLLLLLERAGHGELLVLMGWLLPMAGAALFESVGVKADLGALILGMLLAGHPKTDELAKALLSFKDLFLIGFFLTVGLSGELSWTTVGMGLALVVLLIPAKVSLYFLLMARLRMRARSATLASLTLANFSEFGLIVGAMGMANGWLDAQWVSVFAIALALSFVAASPVNAWSKTAYRRWRVPLRRFQRRQRLAGDELIDSGKAEVVVFGMGRVGTGAFDFLRERWGDVVLGIDRDPGLVERHRASGRNVILGDATDYDFWARAERRGYVKLALLAFPDHQANLAVAGLVKEYGYEIRLASVAHHADDVQELREAGVEEVFNFYSEAGVGFAEHVWERMGGSEPSAGA